MTRLHIWIRIIVAAATVPQLRPMFKKQAAVILATRFEKLTQVCHGLSGEVRMSSNASVNIMGSDWILRERRVAGSKAGSASIRSLEISILHLDEVSATATCTCMISTTFLILPFKEATSLHTTSIIFDLGLSSQKR